MMNFLKNTWNRIPFSEIFNFGARGIVFLFILLGVLLVPLGLPGTWVIVLTSLVYSFFYSLDGGASSALWVNGVLIVLAMFGELMEFVIGTFGSKPLKVSNGAIVCAFIGGIIGAVIGVPVFLIGAVLGLFIGAFVGAFVYEWATLNDFGRAFVNALAVLATRIVASFLKTTLAVGMGIYLVFKIF